MLATIGIYFPAHIHVELCNPGKTPTAAPTNCEHVALVNRWR